MKIIFWIFCISIIATSCGHKGATSKSTFKIFSSKFVDPMATFPGGILVMGRNLDNSQSFILHYTPGIELDLKKGSWEFASIGWIGTTGPMEGRQQCSYERVDINTDVFALTFNMSHQGCLINKTLENSLFTAPYFYYNIAGTSNGFKKLNVAKCPSAISSCGSSSPPESFRIGIPPMIRGISATAPSGLISNCIDGGTSNLTPPYGGAGGGFIGMKITTFSGAGCSGTANEYFFPHGFGEKLNETFIDASGVTQSRRGVLSLVNLLQTGTGLYNAWTLPLNYLGEWSSSISVPSPVADKDLYYYTGGVNNSGADNAVTGNYILYDTTWKAISNSALVYLFLEN